MPTNLKTNEKLIRALKTVADRRMSAEELRNQRVSFVLGSLPARSPVTRAQVEEAVEDYEGLKRA